MPDASKRADLMSREIYFGSALFINELRLKKQPISGRIPNNRLFMCNLFHDDSSSHSAMSGATHYGTGHFESSSFLWYDHL